jgi:large subunit ribosomal protein L10
MPSFVKEWMVNEYAERFRGISNAILVDYTGMSAGQADDLRAQLDERGAQMFIIKNALAVLALRRLDLPDVAELVDGPTALVHGADDPVLMAKALLEWGKKEKLLVVRGGMVEGQAIGPEGVRELADLPPLEVLQAQFVGAVAAPLSGFVGVLQGVVRSFVGVLNAIAEKGGDDA